jgi:predicted nucleotidyltransferase
MMKKYSREDYYDAVNELIEVITGRYRNSLKAIYAAGSFARGDFVPGRSDIDIYVVAENRKKELQRELQGEALKIEKKRFTDLRSIFDEVLGISVTTLKEIREGTSFLGLGFEYSNFIKEGKLVWGEDIKALIPEPSLEKQKESAKNYLGKVYEMVSNQEKYFKWLKRIPFVFVPKAKK